VGPESASYSVSVSEWMIRLLRLDRPFRAVADL
jgi:hypothetical protein